MSQIRDKNTKPEMLLRSELHKRGYRYQLKRWFNYDGFRFRPDLVFRKQKVAVFVDGCFWHKCPKCWRPPKSNLMYWGWKIASNVSRDSRQTVALKNDGWKVVRIWEHKIDKNLSSCLTKISRRL